MTVDGLAPAAKRRSRMLMVAITVVGIAGFLLPFWLPAGAAGQPRSAEAPMLTALVAVLILVALAMDLRSHTRSAASIALLGMVSASAGLLRLLDLPGGGSGVFFAILLAGAAFGTWFGLYAGIFAMVVGALLTGGIGPWLPYQALAAGWIGASAGLLAHLTRRLAPRLEVVVLAGFGWLWGFAYGAIVNLWFWPVRVGTGDLDWNPDLSFAETVQHYWRFYFTTSFAWDAAGALANAVLILLTGRAVLEAFRRVAGRLSPQIEFYTPAAPSASESGPSSESAAATESRHAMPRPADERTAP